MCLGNEQLIDKVIADGGNVNARDSAGFTPLIDAANRNGNIS